jgi:hypothetical protein
MKRELASPRVGSWKRSAGLVVLHDLALEVEHVHLERRAEVAAREQADGPWEAWPELVEHGRRDLRYVDPAGFTGVERLDRGEIPL